MAWRTARWRRARRAAQVVTAAATAVLLQVGAGAPANAAPPREPDLAAPSSQPTSAGTPSGVTTIGNPATGPDDPPQRQVEVPVAFGACRRQGPRPVTWADGSTGTVTPGCVRLDTARLGTSGKPGPAPSGGPVANALALVPPSICPVALSPNLVYSRFEVCLNAPLWFTTVVSTQTSSYTVRVDFTVKMWALLSNSARSWVTSAIVTPTSITGLPAGRVMTVKATLTCNSPYCTVTSSFPANGMLGQAQVNVPLETEYGLSSGITFSPASTNNTLALDFLIAGVTGAGTPARVAFGPGNPIRCDNNGTQRGFENGCVISLARPIWEANDTLYPTMNLVAKHMAKATGNLAGYPGLPGLPGWNTPLTYTGRDFDNYAVACVGKVAPPAEAARGNTSCDEYPFASTAEGAASGGPYSICWVPRQANDSQGGAFRTFQWRNRIMTNDKFYLHATYGGSTPGCDDNLGGGGNVMPNYNLDALFNSYGDSAGCDDWSGGDATNSVVMPNGQRAWFFSDTYLNSPSVRKGLWYASAIHNSIVIQNGSGLTKTITGGNTCQETNLFRPFWDRYALTPAAATDPGGFYWTGDQMVVGSNVIKFYYHGTGGGTGFTIDYPALASIPVSSLTGNTALTISPLRFSCGAPNIIWGAALLNWNGNVYIYGWRNNGSGNNIYLVRTTAAGLLGPGSWQLYTGMSGSNPVWGGCGATAAPLPITNGTTGFSVASVNNGLWLVQFDYANGQLNTVGSIGAHPSATPWGFTNSTVKLYDPPTSHRDYPFYYQQYEARIQPGLGATGQVVISYNVNTSAVDTGCVSANAHDARIYRPRFINVPVSTFNAAAAQAAVAAPRSAAVAASSTNTMPGQGIRHSGPPFPADHPPVPPPSAGSGANLALVDGIDGVTDWFLLPLGGSCPQIPAPLAPTTSVEADGIVYSTWSNVGTDVWYYPYICDETTYDCSVRTTTLPWYEAWLTPQGALWTTGTNGYLDPIDLTTSTEVNTNGHTFAVYIRSFGAGNGNGGGPSPSTLVTVSK